MIFWIASYPKSGNTWIRLLISNYLGSNDLNLFNNLKYIQRFPDKKFFEGIIHEDDLKKDDMKIFKHFIDAQEKINLNNELNILKTHNFAGSIFGYPFTNSQNSCGAIYIIRDPRSVVVSHAYHHGYDFEKSTNRILDKTVIAVNDGYLEARLSWNVHYLSWKNINIPKIILRYEDLIDDPYNSFLKILEFINQFKKIDIDEKRILKSIISCGFSNLSKMESEEGFEETQNNKFFRKGKKDSWKNELNLDLRKKLEDNFKNEMVELGYL